MALPDAEVVTHSLIDACVSALREGLNPADRPAVLYHFTGAEGLLGILRNQAIWACLATELDDELEIRYATELAKHHLEHTAPAASADRRFREAMLSGLAGVAASPYGVYSAECYVTSFCPDNLSPLHWSRYGRGGAGYALGLDATCAQCEPFDLAPVLYHEREQLEAIERLCRSAWAAADELSRTEHQGVAQTIAEAAGHIAATHFVFLAPRIKRPSFRDEAEWRLVSHELFHDGARVPGGVMLRGGVRYANGREVPYLVNDFAGRGLPAVELLVGPGASTELCGSPLDEILRGGLPIRKMCG